MCFCGDTQSKRFTSCLLFLYNIKFDHCQSENIFGTSNIKLLKQPYSNRSQHFSKQFKLLLKQFKINHFLYYENALNITLSCINMHANN